jgi:hypothetical protein
MKSVNDVDILFLEKTANILANHCYYFDSAHTQTNTHDMNLKKTVHIRKAWSYGLTLSSIIIYRFLRQIFY